MAIDSRAVLFRRKYPPCKFSKFKTIYWWWSSRWKFCPYFRVLKLRKEDGIHGPMCELDATARLNGIMVRKISAGIPCKKSSSGPVSAATDRSITQYLPCNPWGSGSCDTSHGRPVLWSHYNNFFIFCWAENLDYVVKNCSHETDWRNWVTGWEATVTVPCFELGQAREALLLLRKGYSADPCSDSLKAVTQLRPCDDHSYSHTVLLFTQRHKEDSREWASRTNAVFEACL